MIYRITKAFKFSAAHSIPSLGPDHKCANTHGHNYRLEVTFSSEELNEHKFVIDAGGDVMEKIRGEIARYWDHRNLNDLYSSTSCEYLCATWWAVIQSLIETLPKVQLASVKLFESETIWAECC